jgi:hypothetical protein
MVARGIIDPNQVKTVNLPGEMRTSAHSEPAPKAKRTRMKDLVTPAFMPPGTWLVPSRTHNCANQRGKLRGHMGKITQMRDAVFRTMGKNHEALIPFADYGIHAGYQIAVKLVRLGGNQMDVGDNLNIAMKWVRDAISDLLGTSDGPTGTGSLITWEYGQERCDKVGVRVTIRRVQ